MEMAYGHFPEYWKDVQWGLRFNKIICVASSAYFSETNCRQRRWEMWRSTVPGDASRLFMHLQLYLPHQCKWQQREQGGQCPRLWRQLWSHILLGLQETTWRDALGRWMDTRPLQLSLGVCDNTAWDTSLPDWNPCSIPWPICIQFSSPSRTQHSVLAQPRC